MILGQRPGARDASLYLARALAVGEAPRFDLVLREPDSLSADDLQRRGIVILNDVPVSSATAERLGRSSSAAAACFVAGQRGAWPQERPRSCPAWSSDAVDRIAGQPARLGALEYGHPMFEAFRAPRSGDFSAARFYGYRAVTRARDGVVLARFDDGAPALLERQMGAGRVLMWMSSLDSLERPRREAGVPAVRAPDGPPPGRLSRAGAWRTVGDVVDPSTAENAGQTAGRSRVALSPSGQRLRSTAKVPTCSSSPSRASTSPRPGRGAVPSTIVATNVDLRESDLSAMIRREIVAAATGRAGGSQSAQAEMVPSDAAQEAAQRVWWYLLFAGLVLLAAETLLSNRVKL